MAGIKYLPQNLDIVDKTIIVRLDLNVPLKEKKIQDHTRINLSIPFLKSLVARKAKIIVISHLGRPRDRGDSNLSLMPVYKYLKEKINTNIYFFMGDVDDGTKNKSSYLKQGEILLLDNIHTLDIQSFVQPFSF